MRAPPRRVENVPHRIAGQPLAMVIGILLLWIWFRVTWSVLDAPTARPPTGRAWPLDLSEIYTLQPPPRAQREPAVTTPHSSATFPIAPIRLPSDAGISLSGGTVDRALAKRLRLAALGGRWSFNQRSSATGGWRGGAWSTGYRDTAIGAREMSLFDGRSAALPTSTADMRPTGTSRRWSASAWLLARPGAVAAGSRLIPRYGASQAGALLEYRLGEGTAPRAYLRASKALVGNGEAEVAMGVRLDIADLPVALHAERRFAANATGRNAMAMFVSGGFAAGDPSQLSVEGFAQAGIVGLRRRTPFADASVVARHRILESGPVSVSAGAGGWTGAQPDATRLDIGPRLEAGFDDGLRARLSLDWRERVAGGAEPDSGPAMTLSFSF